MVSVEEKGPVGEKRDGEEEDKKRVRRKRRRKEKKNQGEKQKWNKNGLSKLKISIEWKKGISNK
jgi:hypothetical protein